MSFTGIPNGLMDALIGGRFSRREMQVLLAIARLTYGWQKKMDTISLSQLAEMTGLDRAHISRSVRTLVHMGIVIERWEGHHRSLGVAEEATVLLPKEQQADQQSVAKEATVDKESRGNQVHNCCSFGNHQINSNNNGYTADSSLAEARELSAQLRCHNARTDNTDDVELVDVEVIERTDEVPVRNSVSPPRKVRSWSRDIYESILADPYTQRVLYEQVLPLVMRHTLDVEHAQDVIRQFCENAHSYYLSHPEIADRWIGWRERLLRWVRKDAAAYRGGRARIRGLNASEIVQRPVSELLADMPHIRHWLIKTGRLQESAS